MPTTPPSPADAERTNGSVTRRGLLKTSAAGLVLGAAGKVLPAATPTATAATAATGVSAATPTATAPSAYSTPIFRHGITSGDPLPDAVILWTRITQQPDWTPGSGKGTPVRVQWEIGLRDGTSRKFTRTLRSGTVTTDASRDFTVKVDATGLHPDTRYVYRFTVLDGPARVNSLRDGHLFRYFRFGTLMDMSVLDLRTYRDKQDRKKVDDPQHSIGGREQMEWLRTNVVKSPCQWKIIGNPVMMAPLQLPPLNPKINDFVSYKAGVPSHGIVFNEDQWDGYQWDRQRLFDAIARHKVKNVVAVTGDIHMSFANDLYQKANGDLAGRRVGVEFIGTSISAANVDDIVFDAVGLRLPEKDPLFSTASRAIRTANQHIKYLEMARHGYAVVEVNRHFTQCDWFYVDDKSDPKTGQHWDASFATAEGRSALYRVPRPLSY